MTEHLPRHRLEQLVADDPHAPIHPTLRVHLAACDHCGMRKRALQAARASYLAAHPALELARGVISRAAQPERAHRRRMWSLPYVFASAAGLFVLAAAALIWLPRTPAPAAIRWKGGASLEVFARRAGETIPLRDGEALSPRDQLAFVYSLDRPRHLLLLGIDDAGTVTRYFPAQGTGGAPLAASPHAQLPVGIELDARKGEERLYGLFSDSVLDEAEARRALTQALSRARTHGAGIPSMGEVDLPVRAVSVWFRKL